MLIASRPLILWIATATTTTSFPLVRRSVQYSKVSLLSTVASAFPIQYPSSTSCFRQNRALRKMASVDTTIPETTLRVGLCQFHVSANKQDNHETAKSYLAEAAQKGVQLAVLPEIWNSPYATAAFPEYAESLPNVGDCSASMSPSSQILIDAAKEHGLWIVGGSIPERLEEKDGDSNVVEKIYNTCLVISPAGEVVAKHRKVHLFDIDVPGGITFFESETLSPGQTVTHFASPFGEIGVGICYDIRFGELAMIMRQKYNCVILIYPGAFNLTTGPAHWELLQRARAVDNQCFVITASPARATTSNDDKASKYPQYTAWGHSTVVSPWGDIVATTDEKAGVVIADLDLGRVEEVRKAIPIGLQRRPDLYQLVENNKPK
mgnify:CR=1 FL=1